MGRSSGGLLGVEEVAGYLGIAEGTVWRWCREGRLPCMKIGRVWRVRREALEEFMRQSESSSTLVGRLRAFLESPDNVLAVAQNRELLHRLDAAFFRVGEARGGLLVKFAGGEPGMSQEEARATLERHGLAAARLEAEGRLRLDAGQGPTDEREGALRGLLDEEGGGRAVWVSFNWTEGVGLETALAQQEALSRFVEDRPLVVKTAVLEEVADRWSPGTRRRADASHSGTIWLTETDLAFGRVSAMPSA